MCNDIGTPLKPAILGVSGGGHSAVMHNAAVLREILDAQREMVCRFGADGRILYVNRAYAQTLGRTPDDLAGQNLWDFVLGDDRDGVGAQMALLTRERSEVTIENRLDTPSGPRWTLWHNRALEFDGDGHWTVAQSTGIDITERRLLEERTRLLIEELNHRVKNTLMVVQAMAYQTFRGTDMPAEPVAKFNERLTAMAAAHTALSRGAWAGAPVEELVRNGTAIFERGGEAAPSVTMSGPHAMMPAGLTVSFVMVLHELATNAMKYGALSVADGHVDIAWSIDATRNWIVLEWRESGGPRVVPPTRKGFGSRLISDAVSRQMRGESSVDYAPDGLVCRIALPLDEIVA